MTLPGISLSILSFASIFVTVVFAVQSSLDNQDELFDLRSAIQVAQLEISNLRDLNDFLSPLLFVFLASNGTLALVTAYDIFITSGFRLLLFGYFNTLALNITYSCFGSHATAQAIKIGI